MAEVVHHTAADGVDEFIPIRKSDVVEALADESCFATDPDREKFRQLCQMLALICHYEYFALLERLRNDYYYFAPDVAPHAAMDHEAIEECYADLMASLDRVLKDANFIELPHQNIAHAHSQRTVLRVEVRASVEDFREVRFYRRGRHTEAFEVSEWFGLRRRAVEAEVYDDVVLVMAMKPEAEIAARRELRALERRKIRPGSVLLKYFRNIATSDLNSLFPNVRVVMSGFDKLVFGLPALLGGIPILLKLYATITVLFLVIGFYLGLTAAVRDEDIKIALAALSGLVALGAFLLQQWIKFQRQSLKYQNELSENVYYRNINNNAGIFDYLVGSAEEQECKETFLAYHFLHAAASPPTADELDGRIEAWLRDKFGVDFDFKVEDALARLERLGLLRRDGGRLFVSPLDGALAHLGSVWNNVFAIGKQAAPI